ncbi:unnamed protein product, partial [Lota lota]
TLPLTILLDSGADESFIDQEVMKQFGIDTVPLDSPIEALVNPCAVGLKLPPALLSDASLMYVVEAEDIIEAISAPIRVLIEHDIRSFRDLRPRPVSGGNITLEQQQALKTLKALHEQVPFLDTVVFFADAVLGQKTLATKVYFKDTDRHSLV